MGDVILLRQQVLEALRLQSHLQVFDGQPDLKGNAPIQLDPDGSAGMYAALYMGVGVPEIWFEEQASMNAYSRVEVVFQVTCAGGDSNRAVRAALKVREALTGKRVATGWGVLREEFNGRFAHPDPPGKTTPHRWFVPVIYNVKED